MDPSYFSIEYDLACSSKNLELFNLAIQKKNYPSRSSHFKIFAKSALYHEPLSIAWRIFQYTKTLLSLALLPLDRLEPVKKTERFMYNFTKLMVFDTINIFSQCTLSITRIASSILGIGFPCLAARVWRKAELLEITTIQFNKKIALYESLPLYSSSYKEIMPTKALNYLGKKRCFTLLRTAKSQEIMRKEHETILSKFQELLSYLYQINNQLFHQIFNKNRKGISSKILNILNKISSNNNQDLEEFKAKVASQLSTQEIKAFFIYIEKIVSGLDHATFSNMLKIQFEAFTGTHEMYKRPLLVYHISSIYKEIEKSLRFGIFDPFSLSPLPKHSTVF